MIKKTEIKDAHPDVVFVPQATSETLEQISGKFDVSWQKVRNSRALLEQLLEELKGKLDGRKFKYPSIITDVKNSLMNTLPTSGDWKILAKFRTDYLTGAVNTKHKPDVNAILACNEYADICSCIADLFDSYRELPFLLRDTVIEDALTHYNKFKQRLNKITFDDILRKAGAALENEGFIEAVRKRFKAGIIDEFQDTDPVQWQIFNTIFGTADKTLFLVGDPRQAIYTFRGGDIHTYLAARKTILPENCHTLTINYRSCPGLLEQVNRWFGEHPCGFATPEIVLPPVKAPEKSVRPLLINGREDKQPLRIIETDQMHKITVCNKIIELLTSDIQIPEKNSDGYRKIQPDDIAVLVRKGIEADEIKELLVQNNVPAIIKNSGNLFKSRAVESIQRILTGILSITDISKVRLALITELCGLSIESLQHDDELIIKKTAQLAELKTIWQQHSFYAMFKKFLNHFEVEKRFAGTPEKLRILTDTIQLGDYLHQESIKRNLAPQALLDHLIYCRTNLKESDQYPQEQETDSGAVIITTMHKSKGLQYPVVILPGLENKCRMPSTYTRDELLISGSESDDDNDLAMAEAIQEELRIAYVALTRAEHACYVIAQPLPPDCKALTPLNWLWCTRDFNFTGSVSEFSKNNLKRQFPDDLLGDVPESGKVYTPPQEEGELKAREALNEIQKPLITTSFSSMAPGHDNKVSFVQPDSDGKEDDENNDISPEEENSKKEPEKDPLRRLRGKTFGLLLHGILENIDFTASKDAVRQMVEQEILLNEPTEEELSYSTEVIYNTLKLQLPDGPVISEISPERRCAEMKFHFAFDSSFSKGKLRTAAAEHLDAEHEKKRDDETTMNGGFITGSIDLLFEHDGKFYILDWKSNLLPDYSQETIRQSVIHSYYQMQYLIYLTAVMRFLKQRLNLPQFGEAEYKKYIGGVYYIYMRGVDPAIPSSGVFFDRPTFEEAQKTAELLK